MGSGINTRSTSKATSVATVRQADEDGMEQEVEQETSKPALKKTAKGKEKEKEKETAKEEKAKKKKKRESLGESLETATPVYVAAPSSDSPSETRIAAKRPLPASDPDGTNASITRDSTPRPGTVLTQDEHAIIIHHNRDSEAALYQALLPTALPPPAGPTDDISLSGNPPALLPHPHNNSIWTTIPILSAILNSRAEGFLYLFTPAALGLDSHAKFPKDLKKTTNAIEEPLSRFATALTEVLFFSQTLVVARLDRRLPGTFAGTDFILSDDGQLALLARQLTHGVLSSLTEEDSLFKVALDNTRDPRESAAVALKWWYSSAEKYLGDAFSTACMGITGAGDSLPLRMTRKAPKLPLSLIPCFINTLLRADLTLLHIPAPERSNFRPFLNLFTIANGPRPILLRRPPLRVSPETKVTDPTNFMIGLIITPVRHLSCCLALMELSDPRYHEPAACPLYTTLSKLRLRRGPAELDGFTCVDGTWRVMTKEESAIARRPPPPAIPAEGDVIIRRETGGNKRPRTDSSVEQGTGPRKRQHLVAGQPQAPVPIPTPGVGPSTSTRPMRGRGNGIRGRGGVRGRGTGQARSSSV